MARRNGFQLYVYTTSVSGTFRGSHCCWLAIVSVLAQSESCKRGKVKEEFADTRDIRRYKWSSYNSTQVLRCGIRKLPIKDNGVGLSLTEFILVPSHHYPPGSIIKRRATLSWRPERINPSSGDLRIDNRWRLGRLDQLFHCIMPLHSRRRLKAPRIQLLD